MKIEVITLKTAQELKKITKEEGFELPPSELGYIFNYEKSKYQLTRFVKGSGPKENYVAYTKLEMETLIKYWSIDIRAKIKHKLKITYEKILI